MHKTQTTPRRPDPNRADDSTIPLRTLHARDIARELRNVSDTARLRVRQQGTDVHFVARQHGDALVRRIFSRHEIDEERRSVRQCLSQAVDNLTPERRAVFSPASKEAEKRIERLARSSPRHDIRAVQVRSPIRLLAYGNGKHATESRPAVQIKPPARPPAAPRRHVTMQNLQFDQARERRLHLSAFRDALRKDKTVRQVLFGDITPSHADTCLCVFSGIVSLYQQRLYDGGASERVLSDLYSAHRGKGKLLELFITHWRAAWSAGKLPQHAFPWAESVNWLVGEFEALAAAEPVVASPGSPPAPAPRPAPKSAPRPARVEHPRLLTHVSMRLEKSTVSETYGARSGEAPRVRRSMYAASSSSLPHGRSKAEFVPGRQAETMSMGGDAGQEPRPMTPRRGHTVSHGHGMAHASIVERERVPPSGARRKANIVRAVLAPLSPQSPLSPLSPASPSSPVFAKLIAMRRGQSAGPGHPIGRMRATTDVSPPELSTKLQRSLSSPYRTRTIRQAAALPGTPRKPLS